MRPGQTTTRSDVATAASALSATGRWLVAGLTGKGNASDARIPCRSLSEFVTRFGERADAPYLYDCAEAFFEEGGNELFVSRTLGPAAAKATLNIVDGAAATCLVATAKSPGAWGNGATGGLSLDIDVSGATFQVKVALNTALVETSPALADVAAAVAWASESSDYIDLALGASSDDPAATGGYSNLAGGTDDRANVLDTHRLTALQRFTRDLGAGQLSYPGATSATTIGQVYDEAAANNRFPIVDAPDTANKGTLTAFLATVTSTDLVKRAALGPVWPWGTIKGITLGTTRTIPPCAVVAGMIARNDAAGMSPNKAPAGINGISKTLIGLSQEPVNDQDRYDLNESGINVIKLVGGSYRLYGFRSAVDAVNDPDYVLASNARLLMRITALCDEVGEEFVFSELDGERVNLSHYGARLKSVVHPFYTAGSLFGTVATEAYGIDTLTPNTLESMADRYMRANVWVRPSGMVEEVALNLAQIRLQGV